MKTNIIAAAIAIATASMSGCHSGSSSSTDPSSAASSYHQIGAVPADTDHSASAPTTPAISAAEQQAIASAQSYLDLGSGFSYQSLLSQLTSNYGNGFSASDAKFAISYLKPDWNAQAVEAAHGYLKLGTGFSRSSLIQQLTSSYGNGFTQSQAEYAVSKTGL